MLLVLLFLIPVNGKHLVNGDYPVQPPLPSDALSHLHCPDQGTVNLAQQTGGFLHFNTTQL